MTTFLVMIFHFTNLTVHLLFFCLLSLILSILYVLYTRYYEKAVTLFNKNKQQALAKIENLEDDAFSFDELGFFTARLSIISELSKEISEAISNEMNSMSGDLESALSNIMNLSKEISSISEIVNSNLELSQTLMSSMGETLTNFQVQLNSIQKVGEILPSLINKSKILSDKIDNSETVIHSLHNTTNDGNQSIQSIIKSIEDIDNMQKEFEEFLK
ncbi:MAG: hypothetical protein MJB14_02900, partial [Spirochaetes bacterium]|nr:hypothetical protein [Spirochaetota bacterium]